MEEKLNNIQSSYNEKLGYKQTIGCFNVKTLTQVIPVLLLLDSTFFFIQTFLALCSFITRLFLWYQ